MNKANQIKQRMKEISRTECGSLATLNAEDYTWLFESLITAVKALEKISKEFGTDYADGNNMIAYDALEKIAGEK